MAKAKSPKGKVTFSYFAPKAQSVFVAGDFTEWETAPVQLKKSKDGTWKKTVTLTAGEHQYRLLVDGQWTNDPNCADRRANMFGSENCVCVVDGKSV